MIKSILLSFTLLLIGCFEAEAKRGVVFIGVGEDISEALDLPDENYGEFDLGYHYNSLRVFFVPLITWDKKFVLVKGDRYADLTEEELKLIKTEQGSLLFKGSLWAKSVNWLWLILIIGYPFYRSFKNKRDRKREMEAYGYGDAS